MSETLKLLCVLAHPDDEALGVGGTLAMYADQGVETYLVCATRGERGWVGPPEKNPGLAELGRIRTEELMAAAQVLKLREVTFLDYIDGDLDQADPAEATAKIVAAIRRIRPQVVVTFGPDGAYGHPDHIAIGQLTTAACVLAADPNHTDGHSPHRVTKLYYFAQPPDLAQMWLDYWGDINMTIDGVTRGLVIHPDWLATARLDTSAYWRQVFQAILCHQTQIPPPDFWDKFTDEVHARMWGLQPYIVAYNLVARGGRRVETDLFEGLR